LTFFANPFLQLMQQESMSGEATAGPYRARRAAGSGYIACMNRRLDGKGALVTGGNSGIGRAIAAALAASGCRVVISGRREAENERVAKDLRQQTGAEVSPLRADVSVEADCRELVSAAVKKLGQLDLLVNNAGIGGGGTVAETDTETFDRVLRTNLYGPFWCSREAFPHLKKNPVDQETGLRGSIINIASVSGKEAWAGHATYCASKFGLMALTQALADEGKEALIRTTAICPALVATPMTGASGEEVLQPEDIALTVLYVLGLSAAAWPTEIVLPRRGAS
jgi:3-oxoacyl-[acyl-carrier protein] reductase